jgi:hypothetical protein
VLNSFNIRFTQQLGVIYFAANSIFGAFLNNSMYAPRVVVSFIQAFSVLMKNTISMKTGHG